MKYFRILFCLVALLLAACGRTASSQAGASHPNSTLTVFAAASLTDAFTEIGRDFTTVHPGVTVSFNFAGSQSLRTQLEQGAVADIFASANEAEMDALIKAGLVAPNTAQVFLTNSLVVILPPGNPASIQTLMDLSRPGLKLDLADAAVPAGKYARQVLALLDKDPAFGFGFSAKALANLVSNETDVRQVVAKVQLGEADAGIVYKSDVVATPGLKTIQIPPADNVIAKYPIATLNKAPQPDLAAGFMAYVLSAAGRASLTKWGFSPLMP
jgi:molybdate transport system substrate-binding protein